MAKKIFLFKQTLTHAETLFDFLKRELQSKKIFMPDGFLRKYIQEGFVQVNDRSVKKIDHKVFLHHSAGIAVKLTDLKKFNRPPTATAELNESSILYEDKDIIVVNKPYGIPTHSTLNPDQDHLVASLRRFFKRRDGIIPYIGLHHRLDKETSGAILFTKNPDINRDIAAQFENRTIEKYYLAITQSKPHITDKFKVENNLTRSTKNKKKMISVKNGGDLAITHFKILRKINNYLVIEAVPETGRTHQIRVHLAELGIPILGDSIYSNVSDANTRLLLHAHKLFFKHPSTNKPINITAPIPEDIFKFTGKF